MYEISAAATGARVDIAVPAEKDFRFPSAESALQRHTSTHGLIAIANPNNPTGTVAGSSEACLRLPAASPQAAILVDEAYFEFYGENVARDNGAYLPNLFVARTFSKAYRTGRSSHRRARGRCKAHRNGESKSPRHITSMAWLLPVYPAALADQNYIRDYVQASLPRDATSLRQEFDQWGIRHWPSQANFVLASFGSQKDRVHTVHEDAWHSGARSFTRSRLRGLCPHYARNC